MSEIKPVGYISRVMCVGPDYGKEIFGKLAVQSLQAGYYSHQKLYDQSAIDRLTAERDAAVAERDAVRNAIGNDMLKNYIEKHGDPIPLMLELESYKTDAKRYRWLRDPNNYPDTDDFDSYWSDILGECCDAQSFDYAIDLAMKEQEQGK